jgi:hypothetical protein
MTAFVVLTASGNVLSLRLVDTERSVGPRFGGSLHEGVQYEAQVERLRHSKFAGIREDNDARTVIKEHASEG